MGYQHRHWTDSGLEPNQSYTGSFLLQSKLPFVTDPGTYKKVVPCARAINNQIAKYTQPLSLSIDQHCFQQATASVSELFDSCRLAPISHLEVLVNGEGQAGFDTPGSKADAIASGYRTLLTFLGDPDPPLRQLIWTAMGKVEYLLLLKIIEEGKQRNITFPTWLFDIRAKRYLQPFAEWFSLHCRAWGCAYGTSNFFGEFHRMVEPLCEYRWNGKDDISGFDRHQSYQLWQPIIDIVKRAFGSEHGVEIDWIFHNMYWSPVHMPNGEIWVMPRLKSGSPLTTIMNCLVHMIVISYMYHKWLRVTNRLRTAHTPWVSMNRDLYVLFYSDDHLYASNDDLLASHEFRKQCYADLGLTLKTSEAVVVRRIGSLDSRLSFLGASPYSLRGRYVPVYDGEKLLSCFCCQTRIDMDKIASQLFSYMILTAFDPKYFPLFKRIYLTLGCDKYITLWPDSQFRNFVSGFEVSFSLDLPPGVTLPVTSEQGQVTALKDLIRLRQKHVPCQSPKDPRPSTEPLFGSN